MDFLDFFENMGIGVGIVLIIFIAFFVIMFLGRIIPALLIGFGSLFYILIIIAAVVVVIYFIGKFAKGFIKK